MSRSTIGEILQEIEELLASAGDLVPEAELAVEKLLNIVEALSSDNKSLVDEVERLKAQLQQKKKSKTTGKDNDPKQNTDHSSEKHRRDRDKPKARPASDRRTFKDLIPFLSIWARRSGVPSIRKIFRPMRCAWKTKR